MFANLEESPANPDYRDYSTCTCTCACTCAWQVAKLIGRDLLLHVHTEGRRLQNVSRQIKTHIISLDNWFLYTCMCTYIYTIMYMCSYHGYTHTPIKMAMLDIFFLDINVSSTPGPASPARTVSPMNRAYVFPAESSAATFDSSAKPRWTLNTIPFLMVMVFFGLMVRELSLNSMPVTKLWQNYNIERKRNK